MREGARATAEPKAFVRVGISRFIDASSPRWLFPHMIGPLFVGREKSIRALEEVMKADKPILLATQMNAADDDPATDAIFTTGTLATVLQLLKLPDGTVKVLVEGSTRAEVTRFISGDGFFQAEALAIADEPIEKIEGEALSRS